MFEKEVKDKKYRDNSYRPTNFKYNKDENLICPNGRKLNFKFNRYINRNKYSRTEEILKNLCSIQESLLCMNRSIQAEGTYGIIKNDRAYKRIKDMELIMSS